MPADRLTVSFPLEVNEQGRPMLWFAAWLVGADGLEGDWFHSGRGAASAQAIVPASATGLRVRRWPNDGFEAEYADILDLSGLTDLDAATLDFDVRQRYSLLRL